jgi:hypothetical protein
MKKISNKETHYVVKDRRRKTPHHQARDAGSEALSLSANTNPPFAGWIKKAG